MSFKTKLKEIIDILKQGHCTGALARDRLYAATPVLDLKASQWCLIGACDKAHNVSRIHDSEEAQWFIDSLKIMLKINDLAYWNDNHKEEVIPALEGLLNKE